MRKRIIAFFLTAAMLLGMMPMFEIQSSAAENEFKPLWPIDAYRINALDHYSGGAEHRGIDIGASNGTTVRAVAKGVVTQTVNGCTHINNPNDTCGDTWGNYVLIKHTINGTDYYSRYAHLQNNSILVTTGDTVDSGEKIALSGGSGSSTGYHLHLELYEGTRTALKARQSFQYYLNNLSEIDGVTFSSHIVTSSVHFGDWVRENCVLVDGRYKYTAPPKFEYKNYYHCDVTFEMTTAEYAWTLPGSNETYPESTHISETKLPVGTKLQATAIYENAAKSDGHYWYETKVDGKTAYVYVPYTKHVSTNWGVSVDGASKPTQVTLGKGFGIYGTVSTSGSKIKMICGYVYPGDTIVGIPTIQSSVVTPDSVTYNLNKEINNTLIFNDISETGYYTYVVKVVLTSYSFKNSNKTPALETSTAQVLKDTRSYFQVVKASTSCSHSYANAVTAPTCTAQGFTTYTCSKCGYGYRDNYTEPVAHSYGGWVVTNAATCTAEGSQKRNCTGCGDMQTQSIPALGHYYVAKQVQATCMQYGYIRYTCTRCGDSYDEYGSGYTEWSTTKPTGVDESLLETKTEYRCQTKQFTTAATDFLEGWIHCGTATQWGPYGAWSQWSGTAVTASDSVQVETATIYGYYHYTCTNCGKRWPAYGSCWTKAGGCGAKTTDNFTFFWSDVSWDAVNFQYWNYDSIMSGKYYTNYFDDGVWYKWTNNGQPKTGYRHRSRNLETIHQFYQWSAWSDWNETPVSASDTVNVETRTLYRYLQADMGAHDYQTEVVNPTCTEQGYTIYICKVCGDTYTSDFVNAKGHSYGAWYHIQEPTCIEKGIQRHDCGVCNHYETQTIPPNGHKHIALVIEPTCVEMGYTTHVCVCGDSHVDTYIEALGHAYTDGFCVRCGYEDPSYIDDPNAPKIVINSAAALAGETVTVEVKLENNPGVAYLLMTLRYDETVLTLVSVENGQLLKDMDQGINLAWSANEDCATDGLLCKLTFQIAENATEGAYTVKALFREAYNNNDQAVTFQVEDGIVEVVDFVYGDANGDGVVNGRDVLLLRKYMANYNFDSETSSVEVSKGADANGDGVINGRDVLLLRKYMANFDFETGKASVILGP